jgi:hypothetical protein
MTVSYRLLLAASGLLAIAGGGMHLTPMPPAPSVTTWSR